MIIGAKLESHLEASALVHMIKDEAFEYIREVLESGNTPTEIEVQEFMITRMNAEGLTMDGQKPIVANTKHAAEPHHEANENLITKGDLILIDIWARKDCSEEEIYADITWMAYAGTKADLPKEYGELFALIVKAREAALEVLQRKGVKAWEVDKACRDVIVKAGHGDAFVHRTGHPIDAAVHGDGYSIESRPPAKEEAEFAPKNDLSMREHIFGTGDLFSIEPGIYYPGKVGLRSEIDVVLHFVPGQDSKLVVTGPEQKEILCLLD